MGGASSEDDEEYKALCGNSVGGGGSGSEGLGNGMMSYNKLIEKLCYWDDLVAKIESGEA